MLSVVVVTNRASGVDALCAGLRDQSCSDFELLLVDEVDRRALLPQPFAVRHIKPSFAKRWGNYMASLNAALAEARGDRLLFLSDFSCPGPDVVEAHIGGQGVTIAPIAYTALPKLHPDFPLRYGWFAMGHDVAKHKAETYAPWLDDRRRHELYEEWRQNYETDLDSGRLDPFMWSCFERPVESFADTSSLRVWQHDRREPPSRALNLKNDSIPRSLLEKIGGFDERADGSHGHQDSITWARLASHGAQLNVSETGCVRLLDAHGLYLIRRMERHDASNLALLSVGGA